MPILRIVLLVGIAFTAFLVVNQILSWRRDSLLSTRQKWIRVISGITLILLLGLILAGNIFGIIFTSDKESLVKNPDLVVITIAYGSLVAGLACLLLLLALLDIREVINIHRRTGMEARARLGRKDGRGQ
jgi:Na+/proline symporter